MRKEDCAKIWFDPNQGFYRVFTKEGIEIPMSLDASVTIEDNFSKYKPYNDYPKFDPENPRPPDNDRLSSAKIEFLVEIVNEEPKLNVPLKDALACKEEKVN
jgi:hypothetical protein